MLSNENDKQAAFQTASTTAPSAPSRKTLAQLRQEAETAHAKMLAERKPGEPHKLTPEVVAYNQALSDQAPPMRPIFDFLNEKDRGRPMSNEELNRRYQEHKRKQQT